jgi:endoglucanase
MTGTTLNHNSDLTMKKLTFLLTALYAVLTLVTQSAPVLKEIRTSSDRVLVVYFKSDKVDLDEINIDNPQAWRINGKPVMGIHKYVMQANSCDHHIYLETVLLREGAYYRLKHPMETENSGSEQRKSSVSRSKSNQVGYSALSNTRFALFTIWQGTGGNKKIEGRLPPYEVFETATGKTVARGTMQDMGFDEGSQEHVYKIDLAKVPEGGPYKIVVHGYGSSYPFGVGGEFSKQLAYNLFRAQYLQRCGCPIHEPDIRKEPCHTLIYDVAGPIGEANIEVQGDEPTFLCYGGYHDAGDADRRAYHMANPVINLMIWEAFPDYFFDGQYDIPGDFDENYHILNYTNNIPDIIDEAEWGTLAWEYLQKRTAASISARKQRVIPILLRHPWTKTTRNTAR